MSIVTDAFPLSFQQEETLRKMTDYPDSAPRYDLICLFEVEGEFDLSCLAAALDDLTARHTALRTVIEQRDGVFQQFVQPPVRDLLAIEDDPDSTVDDVAARLVAQRHGTQAASSGAPLFRACLHRLGTKTLLSIMVHHFVYDGWSLNVLWRDLTELYTSHVDNREARLPSLSLTYGAFTQLQRHAWPALGQQAIPYWAGMITGYPGDLEWPRVAGHRLPGPSQTAIGAYPMSPEALAGLQTTVREMRVSAFTVLLSCTAVAVARVTGQDDLLFGTDTANREDRAKRDMVGFMVNTRLTRLRIPSSGTLSGIVGQVKADWQAAERYRDAYLDKIMEALGEPVAMRVNSFGATDDGDAPRLGDARIRLLPVSIGSTDWRDPYVAWISGDGGHTAAIKYRPLCVAKATIDAVADQLTAVLEKGSW